METQLAQPAYFGWKGAVNYTGLSESTLRQLVRTGKIRAFRPTVGRTVLSREDIDRLMGETQIRPSIA